MDRNDEIEIIEIREIEDLNVRKQLLNEVMIINIRIFM